MRRLRLGDIWILITTDLMARDMDFKGVKLVVNYDFPQVGGGAQLRVTHTCVACAAAALRSRILHVFLHEDLIPYTDNWGRR